ncbi:Gfo/Idh/MocA family oxidoreductase [bacterium]|nr:Gfo/Idh/MocA family oxidoreductase [bacterium]
MSHRSPRRSFLRLASAGAAALAASSYSRIFGANERIAIGLIGCGGRGVNAHMRGIHTHAKAQNAEVTVVCDPWRIARERAAAKTKEWFGREAAQVVSYRDVVAREDIDAVMIASCDHQHTAHLEATAKAKKDAYCEKPLAMDFGKLKSCVDAVKANGIVCQIGTQLRSLPSMAGARKLYQTGVLGKVARIEQHRNSTKPYWYSRIKPVEPKDVDWKEFLLDRPARPFDAKLYSAWYGYREFSDGPVPGLGSHFIDLVHYITGATCPTSAVCMGGTFTWKDEHHFTCPDHVEALWTYPEGFMVNYCTNFGNGNGSSFYIFGDQGTMDLLKWNAPTVSSAGAGKKTPLGKAAPVEHVPMPDHFLDWLQCMRTRKQPNAPIEAGYQHSVAALLAMKAYDTGRRQLYDPQKREIREG